MLDLAQSRDAHIDQRLRSESILWLSSVRPDGQPHLVPVWFLWEGETILIFSQPHAQKVRNLRYSNTVKIALDSADHGEDIVLIAGHAELPPNGTLPIPQAFANKYAALMERIHTTAAKMETEYSQAIRITIDKFVMP